MKKTRKTIVLVLGMLLASAWLMSGCANTPDTVEDPLSAFGIDAVLPFATAAPDVVAPTPTPAPSPDLNAPLNTDYGQSWKADNTVTGQQPLDEDDGFLDEEDDVTPARATPKPTAKPTPKPTAKPSGYIRLSNGSYGDEVSALQTRLKKLGYYNGTVDGQYGSGTVSAVKQFQSILGYEQTGVATASLQKEIYASNAPKYQPTPAPTAQYVALKKGDSGSRVTRLQNRLKTLGYYTGTADGEYGSGTVNAVKRFQKALGLSETGSATVALQTKLFSSSAPYYEKEEPTPAPAQYARLEEGDSGAQVTKLQQRLKALGYYAGTTDGKYGASTVRAVKLFQQAIGVNTTGVATIPTQEKLYSKTAPVYEGDEPADEGIYHTLSPGDAGAAVKTLQQRLKKLGYFDGEIGGNYLTKTTEAVKLFQRAIGVKETGVATVALQEKLFSSSAPSYTPQSTPEPEYVQLSKGDTGTRVERLQIRLIELRYLDANAVMGNYGTKTVDAVKKFEARYGKPETGIATVALQKKLFADDALSYKSATVETPEPAGYVKLQKGDSGAAVKRLQRRLQALGYFEGAIGGNYQQLTIEAVTRFQAALGVKQNGIASVALQQALFAEDAPSYLAPTPTPVTYKKLKRGDTGALVGQLQLRLLELGYIKDAADVKQNTFDKATMLAVIDAQNARGEDSDGVADVDFLTYIYSDMAWDYALAGYPGG